MRTTFLALLGSLLFVGALQAQNGNFDDPPKTFVSKQPPTRKQLDQLDTDFKVWVRKRLSRYDGQFMFDPDSVPDTEEALKASTAAPKDADKMANLAAAQFLDHKYKEAGATADKAIALSDKQMLAHYIAAKLAFGLSHDVDAAKKHATPRNVCRNAAPQRSHRNARTANPRKTSPSRATADTMAMITMARV